MRWRKFPEPGSRLRAKHPNPSAALPERWQHKYLSVHLGLMHGAVEWEQTLLVEGEHEGSLAQRREPGMHQDVVVRIGEHEIVLVVGLQVPERDPGRLVLVDGDERRSPC